MSVRLVADGVSRHFEGLKAVDDASLSVEPGSITGLIGPNGAGKSTLFNLVTRLLDTTAGRILVDDHDVTGASAPDVAALGVARTFQTPRGFPSLSVLENVIVMLPAARESFVGALLGRGGERDARERAMTALERVGLQGRADEPLPNLPAGEQRMLEIARQLVTAPRVLLLDEPTAGVHPAAQERLRELLVECNSDGITILVVEHNLGFLTAIAGHIHVMAAGRVIASGTPAAVMRDPAVVEAYLGQARNHAPEDA